MAAELFVDTSAWYPCVVRSHPDHPALAGALRKAVRNGRRLVTTNLVVAETHALLQRRVNRGAALAFVHGVGEPPTVVHYADRALEAAAMAQWLERFSGQDFSLTDAVSFAVMTERRIDEALALDHHFAEAGFRQIVK